MVSITFNTQSKQVWFDDGAMRSVLRDILADIKPCRFFETECWQVGDKLSGHAGKERPMLHGFVVSLGLVDTTNTPFSCVVAPPLAPKLKAAFQCQSALNVLLPLSFILAFSSPSEWVADLMCGSGSCAVAAAFTGRNSVSIDISPTMVRICCVFHFNSLQLYYVRCLFIY